MERDEPISAVMERRVVHLAVVRALDAGCSAIDDIAYRPAVVKLTRRLPWFWCCQLGRLAVRLDDRWGTGVWDLGGAPDGLCEACHRRAAWLEMGGYADDSDGDDSEDYLATHRVLLCSWCKPSIDRPVPDAKELHDVLTDAASRSIAWSWRWRPG
jgi:hypothetical protein